MGEYSRLRKRRPRLNTKPLLFSARRRWACGLWAAWLLFGSGFLHAQTNAWRDHLTRDDVLKALGEPNSDLRGGGQEIMAYKDGLTINLQNGEVSSITGTVPDALKPNASPAVEAAPATPAPTTPAPSPPAVTTAPAPATATAPISAVKPPTPPKAAAPAGNGAISDTGTADDQDNEKVINDFSTKSIIPPDSPLAAAAAKEFGPKGTDGSTPTPSLESLLPGAAPAAPESPWTQANTIQGFIAGFLLRTVVMTLVLKGTFAYKDFPVIWREVAVVAAGVAFCNEFMAYIFTLNEFLKMLGWIQADQILTGIVLLTLIMNFTPVKRLPTAVGIMMATMSANIALGYAMQIFF